MPDILITPQRGTSNNPSIQFTGSAVANVRMEVLPSGSVAFIGTSGSLFNITDNLLGSLMSVGDVSGLPILEVFSDDRVVMGKYNANTLYVSGTRVGIGKVPSNAVFDVSGSAAISGSATVTGSFTANGRVTFNNGGTGGNGTLTVVGDITTYRSSTTGIIYFGSNQNAYLYYDGSNYNMPNGSLSIGGGATVTATINSSATEALRIYQNNGYISFYNTANSTRTGYIQGNTGSDFSFAAENGASIIYYVGGSERARINTSGNLGIGTNSPSYKVHAYASSETVVAIETASRKWGILTNTSWASNGFSIYDLTADAARIVVNTSGNVGVGTTSPSAKLEVSGDVVADNVLNPFLLMGA